MKFTIIKSCLARFSGIFAVGTPSNIHGTAISYRCAKFGSFVNSVTILTLRDLTKRENSQICTPSPTSKEVVTARHSKNCSTGLGTTTVSPSLSFGRDLSPSPFYKDLGVIFDSNLSFDSHVNNPSYSLPGKLCQLIVSDIYLQKTFFQSVWIL